MLQILHRIETFLKLDSIQSKSEMMRARAVYMIGGVFILTQIVNQVTMYLSYGGITLDHMISVIACILVIGTILLLRVTKYFPLFASIYSLLFLAATFAAALPENTGINSALLPFFVLGIVTNGFICGWRATVSFGAMSFAAIWFLWWISANYDFTPIFDVEAFADRNFQRAVQASLATLMITLISSIFSYNMHSAFAELEAGIKTAQTSERQKTNFLATMSHELCTPMNGIVGISELLRDTKLDEEQAELTAMIQRSSRDMQDIIDLVLLFSQLEAGKVFISDEACDVVHQTRRAFNHYTQDAQDKGVSLTLDIQPDLPRNIISDGRRLSQAFAILIDNAVKFTPTGGRVHVSLLGTADAQGQLQLLFAVQDTGIGIAEENQIRIFERFTQVDGSIKREHGGTGLGLTVARGLVDLMGGTLSVESTVNEGAVFAIRLVASLAVEAEGLALAAE